MGLTLFVGGGGCVRSSWIRGGHEWEWETSGEGGCRSGWRQSRPRGPTGGVPGRGHSSGKRSDVAQMGTREQVGHAEG